jgi:PAS domain S-box-containing protein
MNKVAEALTAWSLADAQGKPLTDVFRIVHETTRTVCENPVDQVLRTKSVVELANHPLLIARDGRELIVADSGAPILDDEGNIIGVVLVFRDMTEKQKLLETAQKSQKLESLGVLAGGIAHDFNNMLSGIFGYIDMAKRKNANEDVERYLAKALTVFGRAKDLTERLLTFSKGGRPVRKTSRIDRMVRENTGFALSGSNVTCEFSIVANLWPCDVDEGQVGQVIDNIVINAKQAMPSGGVISVAAENLELEEGNYRGLPRGRYVRISVRDEGIGIPKEILPQIFDPFFTTKAKGNGLGLATSYSIVKKHDGMIEVESDVGKGSTFHVILPASQRDVVPVEASPAVGHSGKGAMLVMDDEEFILEILNDWLVSMGYSVIRAHNGEEALEVLKSKQKDADPVMGVILDLTIPGGRGGRETISEIRKRYPDLVVFASSGYSDDPVMSKPADYGFTGSIKKPYRLDDLAGLLGKYFGG